jgi:hypothetical protein
MDQGTCGLWKKLATAGMMMTWRKGQGHQGQGKDDVAPRPPEGMDVQEEMLEGPRMRNGNEGPRHKMAAAS